MRWFLRCVDALATGERLREDTFPNGTHEWREQPDNPLHPYISALSEGVDARKVAGQIQELMLHMPR